MAENTDEAKVLAEAQVDAELYTESFLKQLPGAVKDRRKTDRGFCSRLEKRWRRPFELFEGVLLLGLQLGNEFNQEERTEAERRALRLRGRGKEAAKEAWAATKLQLGGI